MKKIFAMLLVLCSMLTLFGCGDKEYAHGSEETVLKIGSHSVPEELYRYFLLNTMDEMISADKECFTGADKNAAYAELDARVLAALKDYYSILDLAKEMGVSLTDDEKKAADDNMQSLRDDCESDEDYQKGLESAYLSEYVAYSLGYNELLYSAVYQTAAHTGKYFNVDGDTVLQFARENFLFCRQFVVKTEDPIGDTQAQVKAEAIHARLKAGEDAAAILKDYESDDKVVGAYYCFAKTEDFLALDEEAVALMEPGQISDIRMDGEGFHIIIRLAPDEEYLDENLTEGVFESYCMHQLVLMQNEIKDAYEVRYINKKTPESYR